MGALFLASRRAQVEGGRRSTLDSLAAGRFHPQASFSSGEGFSRLRQRVAAVGRSSIGRGLRACGGA
ncbi:hypothetical protein DB30_05927 [Enhygromyxa salina]|uniref:Uncharacterized protein n=1 Tax=Enhygromyxa salina TaxID=215803 RepID=A0A0C2A6L5_9BACT|nr:hypothetical protein DB30_05927 [Enhygromyxa salina]